MNKIKEFTDKLKRISAKIGRVSKADSESPSLAADIVPPPAPAPKNDTNDKKKKKILFVMSLFAALTTGIAVMLLFLLRDDGAYKRPPAEEVRKISQPAPSAPSVTPPPPSPPTQGQGTAVITTPVAVTPPAPAASGAEAKPKQQEASANANNSNNNEGLDLKSGNPFKAEFLKKFMSSAKKDEKQRQKPTVDINDALKELNAGGLLTQQMHPKQTPSILVYGVISGPNLKREEGRMSGKYAITNKGNLYAGDLLDGVKIVEIRDDAVVFETGVVTAGNKLSAGSSKDRAKNLRNIGGADAVNNRIVQ